MDLVLVDAPCSATGTMARHPDSRWRLSQSRINGLVRQQAEILSGVADVVRFGGHLAYITCSIEREENELQVELFLKRHHEFRREERHVPDFRSDGAHYLSTCESETGIHVAVG